MRGLVFVLLLVVGCAHDPRPWVRNLKFHGVKKLSTRDLEKKLATQETSWLALTPKRRKRLSHSALEEDKKRVEAWYATHGYFNARVTACEVKPRRNNSVDIHITVEEGLETRLAEVRVLGLEPLGDEGHEMAAKVALRPGEVFDHERYLAEKAILTARLQEAGYPWADVDGRIAVDRDARRASVELHAKPGSRAVFGPVTIDGTSRINPKFALIEADLPVGKPFNPGDLENAKGRLHNLGVFSTVRVEPIRDPAHEDVAPVRITVQEEQKFRTLRLGLGLGVEAQRTEVHGRLNLSWNNFAGGLRRLDLRLNLGYVAIPAFWEPTRHGPQASIEAKLTQPYFPWKAAKSRLTIGYDVGIEYGFRYHGPRAEVGVNWGVLSNHIRFGVSYGFQFLDFFDVETGILSDPVRAGALFGYSDPYRLAWFQEQITFDWRDHALDAKKGWMIELTMEQGGPWTGSEFFYESFLVDGRGYIPLGTERVVLAARLEFGHIFAHGHLESPITRRLYAGGPTSHRGFNYNRLAPQIPSETCQYRPHASPPTPGMLAPPPEVRGLPAGCAAAGEPVPGTTFIPIGGDQLLLGQLELRVEMFKLFGNWVAVAAFLDAGDVAQPAKLVDPTNLHYAVGGGLRYNTVVGAIRFDLGARLNRLDERGPLGVRNPDPGERIAFHISIGEAF